MREITEISNACTHIDRNHECSLAWAAEQLESLNDDNAEQEWTRTDRTVSFQSVREFSAQLYAVHGELLDGEGFDKRSRWCCGLEALRNRTGRYDLQVAGRSKKHAEECADLTPVHSVDSPIAKVQMARED